MKNKLLNGANALRAASLAAATALAAIASTSPLHAETDKLRIVQQFGHVFLPIIVAVDQELIQKHAAANGLDDLDVELFQIGGGSNALKALIAGEADFAGMGIPPAMTLRARTKGQFLAAIATGGVPIRLLTNDDRVQSVEDYLEVEGHQIAVPSLGTSNQYILLQMLAQERFGDTEALNDKMVAMAHPTAAQAIIAGNQPVKSHFATPPFTLREMDAGAREVINSYDILEERHAGVVMMVERDFAEENPLAYQAFVDGVAEAIDFINDQPEAAGEIFVRVTNSSAPASQVPELLAAGDMFFDRTPTGVQTYADFLSERGNLPPLEDWKDLFMPNNHDLAGN